MELLSTWLNVTSQLKKKMVVEVFVTIAGPKRSFLSSSPFLALP
jgi:hypothetical protein